MQNENRNDIIRNHDMTIKDCQARESRYKELHDIFHKYFMKSDEENIDIMKDIEIAKDDLYLIALALIRSVAIENFNISDLRKNKKHNT